MTLRNVHLVVVGAGILLLAFLAAFAAKSGLGATQIGLVLMSALSALALCAYGWFAILHLPKKRRADGSS